MQYNTDYAIHTEGPLQLSFHFMFWLNIEIQTFFSFTWYYSFKAHFHIV